MFIGRTVCRLFRRNPNKHNRLHNNLRFGKARLLLQPLEERAVPAVYEVSNTGDTNDGIYTDGNLTLREAISLANASIGTPDTITFKGSVFNPATITFGTAGFTISDNLAIQGPDASKVTVDANKKGRHFDVASSITLDISGVTLKGGSVAGNAGSILVGNAATVTVTSSVITSNTAGSGKGGAMFLDDSASKIVVVDSEISSNSASSDGGAVSTDSGAAPTMEFYNSLVSGNKAGDDAGGLYFYADGNLTVSNSTFTGNTSSDRGGAIYLYGGSFSLAIVSSTISGNSAATGGGIFTYYYYGFDDLNMSNTILAGNKATTAANSDLSEAITIFGDYNLVGIINGGSFSGTGNLNGVTATPLDPGLSPLSNNGGKTQTMALKAGSPALNAGGSTTLSFDQRGPGFPRVVGGLLDIGAHEGAGVIPTAKLTSAPNITSAGASTYAFTIVYSDETGIDTTTIGKTDIEVSGGKYVTPVNADTFSFTGPATSVTVTYTITPPGGTWDDPDNGTYVISMKGSQVSDTDGPNSVPPSTLGNFKVGIGKTYLVDEATDVDDGIYTVGKLSFREALKLANDTAALTTTDIINFSTTTFASPVTITVNTAMSTIIDPLIVNGPGAGKLTLDGTGKGIRAINIDMTTVGDSVLITDMSIQNFSVSGNGGAILNQDAALTLTNMVLNKNTASSAGGAVNLTAAGATLTVNTSVFSGNTAETANGGAINTGTANTVTVNSSALRNNAAPSTNGDGGAFFMESGSTLLINSSLMTGNFAGNTGSAQGGGVGYLNGSVTMTVTNSTMTGNSSSGSGGAFHLDDPGTVTFRNSTLSSNSAGQLGGAINQRLTGNTVSLYSTIVANNSATTTGPDICTPVGMILNVDASNISNMAGIDGTINQTGVNLLGVDPLLDALADNSGPTLPDGTKLQTQSLMVGSPAIDAGGNSVGLTYDQRGTGFNRVVGGTADMGAFEVQPAAAPPTVTSVVFGDGTNQRSMVKQIVVTFSEAVTFSPNVLSAFTLTRNGANSTQPGGSGNVTLSVSPTTGPASSVTITFSGGFTQNGSLIDGFYDFIISAGVVSGAGGALDGNNDTVPGGNYSVTGTTANKFFRLFGDGDGNGITNLTDFAAFRGAFNLGANPAFDYGEGDNNVGLFDFAQFRARFNLTP